MKTLALDVNDDWTFFDIKSNVYAIAQSLNTRLRSIKGDCYFDLEAGISFANFNNGQEIMLKEEIRDIILNTDGVAKIDYLDYLLDNTRKLTIKYTVQTQDKQSISNF